MFKNFIRMSSYFAVFAILAAAAFFLVHKLINFNKTVIPSFKGKSISEAQEFLKERDLLLKIEGEVYDAEISEGYIVSQDIEPGVKVDAGSELKVYVSNGMEVFSVPSFEGQVFEDAKLTLLNLGIKVGKVTLVHSDTVEKGRVIAQRPLPGNIQSDSANFLVSLGQYDVAYKCPSFIGMSLYEAGRLADMLGVKLVEQEKGDVVISQKPDAGVIINRDDSIEITLGKAKGFWF